MGRAKIIYTVDPDHFKADTMEQFILGGMDIARCVCMQKEKEEQSCFVKQVGDFFKKRKKPVEGERYNERNQSNKFIRK